MPSGSINAPARLEKLRALMRQRGIDIMALVPGPTIRYLTGGVHYMMERPILLLIPLEQTPVAIIPKLEVPLFSQHALESQLFSWTDAEGYDHAFKTGLDAIKADGKVIGAEQGLRFFESEILRRFAPAATLTAADDVLTELRLIKDADEIACMEKAVQLSEQALTMTFGDIRVGMSEREIARLLETHLQECGSEELAFKTIVHAGSNTALPHCGPLDYRVQAGDPLIFDFGGTYRGYCADITRVVFLGEPERRFRDFYEVVQRANAQARAAAQPGIPAEALDLVTKQVFADAGCAHLVRHRTGHGLGLDVHEAPYISQGNQQILQPGMIFTIEPGIYELGSIGVRIEDDMLITGDGARSLSSLERSLCVI
jgi:Xaa-Pro dipeptidase